MTTMTSANTKFNGAEIELNATVKIVEGFVLEALAIAKTKGCELTYRQLILEVKRLPNSPFGQKQEQYSRFDVSEKEGTDYIKFAIADLRKSVLIIQIRVRKNKIVDVYLTK